MAKTTATKTTTHPRRANTDTDLFDMIKRLDSLWRQNKKLDVSPRSPTYEDSMLRQAEVFNEACDLERQIAATRVHTKKGFAAKCKAIIEVDFSDGDLMMIAVLLGRDAERLGIEEIVPKFIVSDALHWFKKADARVDVVKDMFAAMLSTYGNAEAARIGSLLK
jgi:hypothetical protein